MLGEDIIVAPVVVENATTRNIYLPRGSWVGPDGTTHIGPATLTDYSAPLRTLPYFIKSSTLAKLTKD